MKVLKDKTSELNAALEASSKVLEENVRMKESIEIIEQEKNEVEANLESVEKNWKIHNKILKSLDKQM